MIRFYVNACQRLDIDFNCRLSLMKAVRRTWEREISIKKIPASHCPASRASRLWEILLVRNHTPVLLFACSLERLLALSS